jgi:hypothetical protein
MDEARALVSGGDMPPPAKLIGRRQWFRLLQLHFLFTAFQLSFPSFGAENFHAADFAFISLPKLTHGLLLLLFLFHGLAAALDGAIAAASNDDFRAAFYAFISFPYLICHGLVAPLLKLDLLQIFCNEKFWFRDRLYIFRGETRVDFSQQ